MENRRAMYMFFGILVLFKLWTLVITFALVSSWSTIAFFLASHVLWLLLIVMIVAAPAAFWVRLLRVRVKRKKLQQAEWHVEETERMIR